MRRFVPIAGCIAAVAGLTTLPAGAQDKSARDKRTYGIRIGGRDQDLNDAGLNVNRRVNTRIDSRIDNRLNEKLDRLVAPRGDDKSAYTPNADDGTRR